MYLALHGVCVDLAHVLATVLLLHTAHVKVPGAVVRVRHRHPGVVRDHVVVDGLYRLGVRLHPPHLSTNNLLYNFPPIVIDTKSYEIVMVLMILSNYG